MQKPILIKIIALAVLASVAFTAYTYMQHKKASAADTNGYIDAKATVTAVYPAQITRYGAKQPRYDIRFTNRKNEEQQKFRCELGAGYNVGDTLTILYHPENTAATIVVNTAKGKATPPHSHIAAQWAKGKTLDSIKARYKPLKEESFLLNQGPITEFRIALYNYFNEAERHQPIPIKEATWEINDTALLTIWFVENQNQWQPIEQFEWQKGMEF